ncbi:MAG: FG-GAP repeat domain-containing protein [Planctomycetota bacterium]
MTTRLTLAHRGVRSALSGSFVTCILVGVIFVIFSHVSIAQSAILEGRLNSTDLEPAALAVADINGDTHPDIVAAHKTSSSVAAFLGDGAGGFGAKISSASAGNAVGLVLGDFNNDGKLDSVVLDSVVKRLALNLGSGTGAFGTSAFTGVSHTPTSLAARDLNQDGNLDCVSSTNANTNGYTAVRLGNGAGGFGAESLVNNSPVTRYVLIGDLNNDNKADLVTVNSDLSINANLGNGLGGFGVLRRTNTFDAPAGAVIANFTSDGFLDVAFTQVTVGVYIYRGLGNGFFAFQSLSGSGGSSGALDTADLNGDAKADVVVANYGLENIVTLYGDGAGQLGTLKTYAASAKPVAVVCADVNHDALPDVSVAHQDSSNMKTFLLQANGLLKTNTNSIGASPFDMAAADFNLDGNTDLILSTVAQTHVVAFGDGTGGVTSSVSSVGPPLAPFADGQFALGDLNHDGKIDVVLGQSTTSFLRKLGDGLGGFASSSINAPSGAATPVVFDANGDGDLDAIAGQLSQGFLQPFFIVSYYGDGTGNFPLSFANFYSVPSIGTFSFIPADLNNDGNLDLLIQNTFSMIGDGTGVFSLGSSLTISPFISVLNAAVHDLNSDGNLDVAFAGLANNPGPHGVKLNMGNGNGTFSSPSTILIPGSFPTDVRIRDINSDLRPDILLTNTVRNSINVLVQTSPGIYTNNGEYFAEGDPASLAIADFDQSGRLDVAVTGYLEGSFVILQNIESPVASSSTYGAGTFACTGRHGIAAAGVPAIGNADFGFVNTNVPSGSLGLLIVTDAADAGSDPLGAGVAFLVDLVNATQLLSFDQTSDMYNYGGAKTPIPNDPMLQNLTLYAQGFWYHPGCTVTPLSLSSSSGLSFTIQ